MKRIGIVLGVLLGGAMGLWGIDLMALRAEANRVLAGHEAMAQLPDEMIETVLRLEGTRAETFAVQSLLLRRAAGSRSLIWHVRRASWLVGRDIVLSKQELARVFLYALPYEKGEGIQAASAYYFAKAPADLATRELVQLLVISRAPRLNSPTLASERHEDLVEEGLSRLSDDR